MIAHTNLFVGTLILLFSFGFIFWTFYIKTGFFNKSSNVYILIWLLFMKIVGLILGFFSIPKLDPLYETGIVVLVAFLYALIIGIKEALKLLKLKR